MAFVIAEPCISVKDTACVEVCPVDCIYEGEDQLFISPEECIDCGACEPVCPVLAIFPLEKVPSQWEAFIQKNIDFFKTYPDAKPATKKGEEPEEQKEEIGEVVVAKAETTVAEHAAEAVVAQPMTQKPPLASVKAEEKTETAVEETAEKPKAKPVPVVQKPVDRPRPVVVKERTIEPTKPTEKLAQPTFRLKAPVRFMVKASQPLTGALSAKFKRELEEIAQDPKIFSAALATGLNCLMNTVLYVLILTIMGVRSLGDNGLYSNLTNLYIFIGLALGILETALRFKKGMIMTVSEDNNFPATWYGKPLSYIFEPLLPVLRHRFLEPIVVKEEKPRALSTPAAAVYADDLRERDRRYGLVHSMLEKENSYLITIEFPRRVPYSKRKEELKLPAEMPDYKRQITLQGNMMFVETRLEDLKLLEIAGRASSFPSSFLCEFKFDKEVFGFEDKYQTQNKILEITVYKKK